MKHQNLPLKVLVTADNNNCPEIQILFEEFQHDFFDVELTDSHTKTLNAFQSDKYDIFLINYPDIRKNWSKIRNKIVENNLKSKVVLLIDETEKESFIKKMTNIR